MVLKLDPALAVVWRTPTTLQVGADEPRAVIADVTPAAERVMAALRIGAPRSALVGVAGQYGGDAALVERMLRELEPALCAPRRSRPQAVVTVAGTGAEADAVRDRLRDRNALAVEDDPSAGLAVLVADFVVPPWRQAALMRRDQAHLPVVLGDQSVEVGPLIQPGDGPCLRCISLARRDADPAWPALCTQLAELRASTRGSLAAEEAVLLAVRAAVAWAAGRPSPLRRRSIRIDAASGDITQPAYRPHPECGCSALPRIATVHALPAVGRR